MPVTAAGAGPASISCLLSGSTRRFSPSNDREPSRTRSPASPNTTSSRVSMPATRTITPPVQRASTVPSAWRKRHILMRSIPRVSRTGAGNHDSSAPVSTSTDSSVRHSLGRAGFASSRPTRNVPISSCILPPSSSPSSTMGTQAVSIARAALLGAGLLLSVWLAPLEAQRASGVAPAWTRGAVCYEVFVRSFYDSNGDGIGDLNGLIEKLDYIAQLGASCVWLMPVAASPSYHGYDVSDYYKVEPAYGTNDDFKRLVKQAHRRGIVVLVDMVLNHSSSEHPYFQAALHDTTSPYRAWYRFAPQPLGKGPWGGEAWHRSPVRDEYYYGVFWSGMPDLNYETPPCGRRRTRSPPSGCARWTWTASGSTPCPTSSRKEAASPGVPVPTPFCMSTPPTFAASGRTRTRSARCGPASPRCCRITPTSSRHTSASSCPIRSCRRSAPVRRQGCSPASSGFRIRCRRTAGRRS